jgi:hypothetical protein
MFTESVDCDELAACVSCTAHSSAAGTGGERYGLFETDDPLTPYACEDVLSARRRAGWGMRVGFGSDCCLGDVG